MGTSLTRDVAKAKAKRQVVDANPPKCKACGLTIEPPRRYVMNVKYCNPRCRKAAERATAKEKAALQEVLDIKLVTRPDQLYGDEQVRRGPLYDSVMDNMARSTVESWMDRKLSDQEFQRQFVATTGNRATVQALGNVRRALWNDRITGTVAQGWTPKGADAVLLGPSDADMQFLAKSDPKGFNLKLDLLTDAFVEWRTRFFQASYGTAYLTKPVHRRWIRACLETTYLGGRSLILSPPRHGKTDLLAHFCVWKIIRNPNIRILWVGPNEDIAKNSLSLVKDILSSHEELKEAYLAPGQTWEPNVRGKWSADKFTVATRTMMLKQPTMWCAGVESKILSVDADDIVVDDPADPDASYTQGGRDKVLQMFRQRIVTRKMAHTGLNVISSRVHPEDLYSWLIENPNWSHIVDRAHDAAICGRELFEDHESLPDPEACILFPELNNLAYLREQHDDVGPALFEMMYLNQPRPDGTAIFDPEKIRANALDPSRDVGIAQLPVSYRLVAGLDPAARGVQASFLWAVTMPSWDPDYNPRDPRVADRHDTFYMVDMETQQAGGIDGALAIMRDWAERYDNRLWVVEDNAYQSVFFDDPRVKALARELDLTIRPTHTGKNKHDDHFGVTSLAEPLHEGHIILPYASPEAKRKVEGYIRQLVNFTNETRTQRRNLAIADILMASWFPFADVIRKWKREARMQRTQVRTHQSFPDYVSASFTEPPWGPTGYLGVNESWDE